MLNYSAARVSEPSVACTRPATMREVRLRPRTNVNIDDGSLKARPTCFLVLDHILRSIYLFLLSQKLSSLKRYARKKHSKAHDPDTVPQHPPQRRSPRHFQHTAVCLVAGVVTNRTRRVRTGGKPCLNRGLRRRTLTAPTLCTSHPRPPQPCSPSAFPSHHHPTPQYPLRAG